TTRLPRPRRPRWSSCPPSRRPRSSRRRRAPGCWTSPPGLVCSTKPSGQENIRVKTFSPYRLPLVAAASLALALAPPAAAADPRPSSAPADSASVTQLNEEGAALYAARDYRRAIEKFIQAYAIDADPNLLFNI